MLYLVGRVQISLRFALSQLEHVFSFFERRSRKPGLITYPEISNELLGVILLVLLIEASEVDAHLV